MNVLRLILFGAVVVSLVHWLRSPLTFPVSHDEVVWMLDAEAFTWYAPGSFEQFQVTQPLAKLRWYDHQYRVIDQPQLGKYLVGALLVGVELRPWESPQKHELYMQFSQNKLPKGTLQELTGKIDDSVLESIKFLRLVNTGLALLAFFLLAWFINQEVGNEWAGPFTFILLVNNEIIYHYYRSAVVNTYSFVMQLFAVVSMVIGIRLITHSDNCWKQIFAWGGLTGFLVAAATSIKLDGAFLVVGPLLIFLLLGGISLRRPHHTIWLQKFFVWASSFMIVGVSSFLLFEPETWVSPLHGVQMLFSSRLIQHQRFLIHLADLSWGETVLFWLAALFKVAVMYQIFLVVALVLLFYLGLVTLKKRRSVASLVTRHMVSRYIPILVFGPIFGGALFCSRVGIDRYTIPAVIVSYVSIGLVISWSDWPKKLNSHLQTWF